MKKLVIGLLLLFVLTGCKCSKDKEIEDNNNYNKQEETYYASNNNYEYDIDLINELLDIINLSINKDYKSITIGNTKANVGIMHYNQKIYGEEEKKDDVITLLSTSSSFFVDVYHKAIFDNGYVSYKNKEEDSETKVLYEEYRSIYGVIPSEGFIGYIINSDTITGIIKNDNNYKIMLDNNSSTIYMAIQMKEFGGLNSNPIFKKIELSIDTNEVVTKVTLDSEYQISKSILGTMNCTQHLEIDFKY